jgi:hypothetical protein
MGDYHPSCNGFCPKGFAGVIHACVRHQPAKRPTAADVVTSLNGVISDLNAAGPPQVLAPLPSRHSAYGHHDTMPRYPSNGSDYR